MLDEKRLAEIRDRAENAPRCAEPDWDKADDVALDAIERVPPLAADVLALLSDRAELTEELDHLRGEVSTLTAMEEHAREERDALLVEVERLKAIEAVVRRFADKQPSSVPEYIEKALAPH